MPNSQKLSKLKKYYEITLETITPVHVGSGEEYINGLDFIGDIFFDINRLMREASTDSKMMNNLCNEIEKGNLRNFYNSNRELFSKISEKKSIPNSIFGQNIKKHIKTNGKIYLPGSSIKGAIRTAIAASYAYDENHNYQDLLSSINDYCRDTKYADKKLLESMFGKDPKENLMRILTVTDATVGKSSRIYEMLVLNSVRMRGKKIFYEMIPENTELRCSITLDQFLSDEENRKKAKIPKHAFSFNEIIEAIKEDADANAVINMDFQNNEISSFYKMLKENYLDKGDIVFNLGAGIGWIGTTGNLIGKKLTESVRKNLRLSSDADHIKQPFPKTRRVVDVGRKIVPPGWVKMTFEEIL
ncbi:MAG TPA: type III-A CRISPR-associated RAMP protein Csm5 [bacterium]|jgi:CRISPR-associated protein Csm5|nr:type III-A CRISPR-associated RAMP protein Csm5 [bacterium]HQB09457.1 type III-A CRISPR-associated RAMP protein Csm5 [bacterium]HRQ69250.1 type III-A CRISPR-associated RAMP protein Csm5 [bacterium]